MHGHESSNRHLSSGKHPDGGIYAGQRGVDPASASLDALFAELRSIKFKRRLLAVALLLSDGLACVLAVFLAQLAKNQMIDPAVAATVLAGAFPVYFLAALQTGAHDPAVARRPSDSIRSAGIAFLVTAAIFFGGLFVAKISSSFSRLQVGQTLLVCFILGAAGRYAIAKRSMKVLGARPFADLCIYDDIAMNGRQGRGAIQASAAGLDASAAGAELVARLGDLARGMDRVVVHCSKSRRQLWSHALKCIDIRSEIVIPELTELMPLDIRYRNGEASLVLANGPLRWHQRWTKNLFDRAVAAIAILLAAPLMLLIALAVKLDSRGPVLFRQERIGLGNRRFEIWKFRTMRSDLADREGKVSTLRDDGRVTRIGRFLRRTSLDELPQLFNVLIGQMSIVGPRPHAVGSLAGDLPFGDVDERYWQRHSIRPGITGLAQIRGLRGTAEDRNAIAQRLHADLEYVANWSLMTDLRIIFQTFAVLMHRNAY